MWKRWYGDSCPYCFWWLEQVLYTILYAFSSRFQCTKPHSIWWRTEGVMIEIVGVKSMQGGFQLKWVGNQWMDWAAFIIWCSYSIGNGVCQVTGQGNRSPLTHMQDRVGKAKMGGCRWGYHGNHLCWGLAVLGGYRYALGRLIYQPICVGRWYCTEDIKNGAWNSKKRTLMHPYSTTSFHTNL